MSVITGVLALVKVDGTVIGKAKGINVTENIQRADVRGLGHLAPQERPAVSWNGTLRVDFILVNLHETTIPGALNRNVNTVDEFTNALTLGELPVTVSVFKKITDPADPLSYKEEPFAVINNVLLTSDAWNINEGTISGRNMSFDYLSPVVFPS